jgi:hypothetical protein
MSQGRPAGNLPSPPNGLRSRPMSSLNWGQIRVPTALVRDQEPHPQTGQVDARQF